MATKTDELLTAGDIAAALKIDARTARRWINGGYFGPGSAVRLTASPRGPLRLRASALATFIETQTVRAIPASSGAAPSPSRP